MWRTGPAFSPSRASRAAVSASSGAPSDPQPRFAWLTPERRYSPWSVRTWRSSPECELAMIAISAGSRSNSFLPPASRRATTPNGLTVERSVTTRSGSPSWWMIRPAASVSTTSPRWTLSSIPLRIWRTRIGVGAFARLVVRGLRDGPRAAPLAAEGPAWTVTMQVSGFGQGSVVGGEDTATVATMGALASAHRPEVPLVHAFSEPARLAASGGPPQARDPARRAHRAEE